MPKAKYQKSTHKYSTVNFNPNIMCIRIEVNEYILNSNSEDSIRIVNKK